MLSIYQLVQDFFHPQYDGFKKWQGKSDVIPVPPNHRVLFSMWDHT